MNRADIIDAPCTDLVVTPHPLTLEGRTITRAAQLQPGDTLVTFLGREGVDLSGAGWCISIGGAQVPELLWGRTRPAHGHVIEVRRQAGKSALRIVALVALAYFTLGAGSLLAGGLAAVGITGFAAFAIQAGVFMLGSMLVNKLLPPAALRTGAYDNATATTYSLQGARNAARLYEPLGLLFGSVRVTPDFAAQPYSWFASDEQYQYLRLHAGINVGEVTDIKVGDTLISTYDGVLVATSGFAGSSAQLLDWSSVDTVAGALLDAATAPGAWTVRTSSVGTTVLALDIAAQLYALNDQGAASTATVGFDAERRLLPSGSWEPFMGGSAALSISNGSTKPVRRTLSVTVTLGQYELRLRKTTVNAATTRTQNELQWVSLKSYQPDATDYSNQPQVGISIKASGQLNGTLDQVNWQATSKPCELWNGSAWVSTTTSNPGAHFLRFARGIYDTSGRLLAGMGKPDSQIDIEGLKAFMLHCAANSYRFDHWFDRAATCGDMLDALAAAGLGAKSYHTGRLGVVWAAQGQPIEAVISPVRMKPGSFQVDYSTRELSEELEVTSPERTNNWLPASVRVKAPGVGVPRDTARLSPVGVTTEAGRLLQARFTMAQNIYQRKAVVWDMDLEHIAFRRFSVVALSHDITQWGYSGRLHAAVSASGVVTIELDREVPYNPGAAARYVALHIPGEQGYRVFGVQAFTGTVHSLTLSGAWPSGVPFPGDSSSNPAHDTVWLYDFKAAPGQRLRVVGIEPTAGMVGARITAVPEPDEFWSYVFGAAYEAPAGIAVAQPVVVSNVQVTQGRSTITQDDSTELTLTWDASGPYDHAQVWGSRQGDALQLLGEARTTRWQGWRVGNDGVFAYELRPFDSLGRPGAVVAGTHTVLLYRPRTGNLIDPTWWQPGAAWEWTKAENPTGEVSIVWGNGPRGNVQALVQALAAGTPGASIDGGWEVGSLATTPKNAFVVDPSRAYRFAVPVRRVSGSGPVYLGTAHDLSVCDLNTSTGNSNPYFYGGALPTLGDWYLLVGYIYPAGSTGLTAAGSGLYNMATGALVAVGDNWCWSASAVEGSSRAFQYYASTGATVQFAPPTVELVDGTEGSWIAGPAGASGTSIYTATVYKQTGSAPSAPTGGSFDFGTSTLTAPSGWTITQPATTTTPTYACEYTFASSTPGATVTGGSWTTPYIDAVAGSPGGTGSDGESVLVLEVYLQTGSAPSTPSGGSYTFSTDSFTAPSGGWSRSLPASSTTPTYRAAFRFATNTPAVAVTAGSYTAPVVVAQNGAAGANAKALFVSSTSQVFQVPQTGSITPASITFTAVGANLAGSPSFSVIAGTATLTGSGSTRALASADMGSDLVTVQVSQDGLTDTISVVKVREGAAGAAGANGSNGSNGTNGSNAVVGLLTNESHTVPTASDGSGGSFTSAGGVFLVFDGLTDRTGAGSVTYSLVSSSSVTVSIASTGVYTVSAMSADIGTATLRAVYAGVTIDKVYSIAKSKAGTDGSAGATGATGAAGAPAQLLTLTSTAQLMTFDTDGVAVPASQTITCTAVLQNVSGTATFTATRYNLAGTSLGTVTLGGSGNTRTLTDAQFGAAATCVISASLSGLSDTMTIARVATAAPASAPVVLPGSFYAEADAITPTDADAFVEFRRDGSVYSYTSPGGAGYTKVGDWFLPNGTAVGDAFEVRFDLVSTQSSAALAANAAVGAFSALSSARIAKVVNTSNSPSSREVVASYNIRRISTGGVVSTGLMHVIATVEPDV